MCCQYMMYGVIVLTQIVIGWEDCAAWNAKYHIHTFVYQTFPDDLTPGFLLAHLFLLILINLRQQ